MRMVSLLALALAVTGCVSTLPIQGEMSDGSKLTGTATTDGTIRFASSNGLSCSGTFTFQTSGSGTGAVSCSNGQSGAFTWNSSGGHGFGRGQIGGRPFSVSFQNV
jgi:hypothetical protein